MQDNVQDDGVKMLFDYSNAMADWVKNSPEAFTEYLRIASSPGCKNFTVANKMLILGYGQGIEPDYMQDASVWARQGIKIKEGAVPIYVMEHEPNNRLSYKIREMYDIKQTTAEYEHPVYDISELVETMMLNAPCKIAYNESQAYKAMYIPDKNTIEVSNGFKNFDQIFVMLAQEFSHCIMYQKMQEINKNKDIKLKYPRGQNNFIAYCSAYMLASRYGVSTQDIQIKSLPQEYENMDAMEFKKNLEPLDIVTKELNSRIAITQKINNKEADLC